MSIGHRIFIVEEDALPMSQRVFNELHSCKAGILPKCAGQTVLIAVILYALHQRKPKAIIQNDCKRIRILGDGSIDINHEQDGMNLAATRIGRPETKPRSSGTVVDATARFEERQWDVRHPELSELSYKRILNALLNNKLQHQG